MTRDRSGPRDAPHQAGSGLDEGVFRELSELQARFRELLGRALERRCGGDWFKTECPPEVFERLIRRKESELLIDRCASEYQELINYAEFCDMADIVAGIDGTSEMFIHLASSPGHLYRAFDTLDRCRRHLSLGHRLTPSDRAAVRAAHRGFASFLKKIAAREDDGEDRPQAGAWDSLEQAWDNAAADRVSPGPAPPELRSMEPSPRFGPPPAAAARQAAERARPPELVETWGVAGALRAQDDPKVLKSLWREVSLLAGGFFGEQAERQPAVWETLRLSGWLEARRQRLDLTSLERFYGLVESYRGRRRAGATEAELEALLAEHDLPALLLKLREFFTTADLS